MPRRPDAIRLRDDHLLLGDSLEEKLNVGSGSSQIPGYKGLLYEVTGKDCYGNRILKKIGENTVTVGGAIQSLEKLCGVEASWKPKTLNEIHDIDNDLEGSDVTSTIALFGVGKGGSGLEFGSIVEKDVKMKETPGIIPMRSGSVLTGEDADLYYFKKDRLDGDFDWYLKEFKDPPIIKTCWKDTLDEDSDGTEVKDDIENSDNSADLQTFAEYLLDFNTKDVREYYESIGALDRALYNSIGLYLADKVKRTDGTGTDGDEAYGYANIRLFSYLNIDNKSVRIKTASQYIYRILSLV